MTRSDRNDEEWAGLLRAPGIPGDAPDRVTSFLGLLARWGHSTDLFGGAEPEGLVRALVRDTLAALPWVAESGRLVDVGSGNGFPAVPLLIARPGLRGVLLEPRERRWAFLKEVVRELGLEAEVRRERIAEHRGSGYGIGTVRGVEMRTWLPEATRLVSADATWLWWTSAAKAAELERGVSGGRVLTSLLPGSGQGVLAVWRRCST